MKTSVTGSHSSQPASAADSPFAAIDSVVMTTYGRYPLEISHGAGSRLYGTDGKEYLDFVAGIATCALGHAHPAVADAVSAQLRKVLHVSNLYILPQQIELAQWLVDHSPADKVFFCNSGAEANEAAIKLSRKFASIRRGVTEPIILSAESSFHGRTLAALTATAQPKYHRGFAPLVPGFQYVPYNDTDALRRIGGEIGRSGKLAALFLESVQGEGGVRPGEKEYFKAARELCDETGALLVIDEVQTGVGRTGTFWGIEQLGVEPDLITSAKALGNGIPIGALLAKAHCAVFEPGDHASTFGGNAIACTAALTVCRIVGEQSFLRQVSARGEELERVLASISSRHPDLFAGSRGRGLIRGLVLRDEHTLQAADIVRAALAEGLLVLPAGPKVVRLVPPLIVTSKEIEEAGERLLRAVARAS